jgi:uncharacterized protein
VSAGKPPKAFVAVLVIHLHFPEAASLKAKRRELAPVKAHLQGKLGVALAEVEHQDRWQRATLVGALTADSSTRLGGACDLVERWLDGRFPQGVRVDRTIASVADLYN